LSREKRDTRISNRARINDHEENDGDNQRFSNSPKSQNITLLLTTFQEKKCYLCQEHFIYSCNKFLSFTAENRIQKTKVVKIMHKLSPERSFQRL